MAKNEPCPTRFCHFEWKPISKTIHITLDQVSHRQVKWAGLEAGVGPKSQHSESFKSLDGPSISLVVEAQLAVAFVPECLEILISEKGSLVNQCHVGESSNTKLIVLEISIGDSLSDGEGIESEWPCEAPRMESGADDEMVQGVHMSQEKLVDS